MQIQSELSCVGILSFEKKAGKERPIAACPRAPCFGAYNYKVIGQHKFLMGGFFNWLGFIASITLSIKGYKKKPWVLWILDNGFWLILLILMGAIETIWIK